MGIKFPEFAPSDGDDETLSPSTNRRSILGADPVTGASRRVTVDSNHELWVNVKSTVAPLPSGAATEATQLLVKADLDEIKLDTDNLDVPLSTRLKPGDSVNIGNFPATQNVNVISSVLPTGAATELTLAGIKTDTDKLTFSATRLLVDGSGVTQPISGIVTANQGTNPWLVDGSAHVQPVSGPLTDTQLRATPVPISGTVTANLGTVDGLALDVTLTNGNQKTKLIDAAGVNVAVVDATGDVQVDVNNFPASQTVNGTVTVVQPSGASLHVDVDNFPATQNVAITSSVELEIKNDVGNPIPISAASLPLPTGASTAANQATANISLASIDTKISNDSAGAVFVDTEGKKSTYSIAVPMIPGVTPTDIFSMIGSASKVVKIRQITISGTDSTTSVHEIIFLKRSTGYTGGTGLPCTVVKHDSADPANTTTAIVWSVNPTLGTLVGWIAVEALNMGAAGSATTGRIHLTFGTESEKSIVLRGANESFAINLNGTANAGSIVMYLHITWTEE